MSTVLRYICKAGDGDFSRSENFQNYTCLACLFQAGNDTLVGNGGADVIYGGAGNDVLVVNEANISALSQPASDNEDASGIVLSRSARIDGGSGIDTLQVAGGTHLNLTAIGNSGGYTGLGSRINSIEKIDLATDTYANTLTLALQDVLDMAGANLFNTSKGWTNPTGLALTSTVNKHQLVVTGSATDSVDIVLDSWSKVEASTVRDGPNTYEIWNHNTAAAQLLIQQILWCFNPDLASHQGHLPKLIFWSLGFLWGEGRLDVV